MSSTIRNKAEAVMQERYTASELRQDADLEAILHELRVHQIELELQNDELRRTQVDLETMQRKYFDLYRLAPVAYLHLDDQGIIQDLNLKGAELLGGELQMITNRPLVSYLESGTYGEFFRHLQAVFANTDRQTCEVTLRARNGVTRNVLLESIAAWEDGNRFCRTVMIDVTARYQAERELQQSEARLRALFEASPVPLATISRIDGTIRYANPALGQLLAASLPAMIGRMAPFPKDLLQFLLAGPWDQASIGREWRIVRNNGEHIWVVVTCQTIVLGTEPCMMAGFHDVTERRTMEESLRQHTEELRAANAALVEAARLKDQFLANMSHELRTPLTGILGMAEALGLTVYGALNERQLRAIDTIEQSGRHLLDLITDILDLAKVEAGKLELVADAIQMDVLCDRSIQMVEQLAQAKHQKFSLVNECSHVEFLGDERRLRQVIVNLLSNAVKFTGDGGELGLNVVCDRQQRVLIFTVWDTGIGIHADDIHRLFQPFVQIDSGLARQYAGTGLGLALVRRFTELHGGSVVVDSSPGKGSRFTVRIPLITSPAPSSAVQSAPSLQQGRMRRIVMLEDSAITAEHLANYLRILGILDVTLLRLARGRLT
ncbi:MAG: PAS domain-containing sensor histidine kinase [Anaerolineales bacterium]|nr:PAS domain-containing sensor histidine kinase [Anaerolineales bacterium]